MTDQLTGPLSEPRTLQDLVVDWTERLADEAVAFAHEHGRLYNALELAAQRAELAGHDRLAEVLRDYRHAVAAELNGHACTARPPAIVEEGPDGRPTT